MARCRRSFAPTGTLWECGHGGIADLYPAYFDSIVCNDAYLATNVQQNMSLTATRHVLRFSQ